MFSVLELMAFELHQSKRKWLFFGIYQPHPKMIMNLEFYIITYQPMETLL